MATIFSKIINGEIPSYKVYEDEWFYAFLDIRPMVLGHTLVIPKKETDYLFDMADAEYSSLLLIAKKIAKAIKKTVPCTKVGMTVVGLEVPHAHVHLMPIDQVAQMNFKNPVVSMSDDELTTLAAAINRNI